MQELEILQNKETREQMINKVEVLEKVGNLLLLSDSKFGTSQQVADYYLVDMHGVRTLVTSVMS